ncbi:hypothetical protein F4775DRAFT_574633 [Biscogniauxia sp. FL1348]|nr:hypothetical protein F4775DRAFT_574633 [Biscogniauxia sp. FL1348]
MNMNMTATTVQSVKKLTWLITGCSSGFGLAFAREAQARGHMVIATSRNPSRTPDLVAEITSQGGRWVKLDVDDPDCGAVISSLESQGTQVDILINCAGFSIAGPLENFQEDEVRRLMETNFFGPYRLTRAAAPHMRKRRSGVIVNISTGSGFEASESLGMYGASKAALDSAYFLFPLNRRSRWISNGSPDLTKTLHKEMKEFNVRVLLVPLGTFNTPMIKACQKVSKPLDPDYQGTLAQKNMDILESGDFAAPGDHKKAVKVICDMAMGEGVGKGLESEMMLPLGVDMAVRAYEVRDRIDHMMHVFGDVCNNVNIET